MATHTHKLECKECGNKYIVKTVISDYAKVINLPMFKDANGVHRCKKCRAKERNTKYKTIKNKLCRTKYRTKIKRWHLKKNYGITLEEYETIFTQQGCVCAICKKPNDTGKYFPIDHDHITGAIRGILCDRCNMALGIFKDQQSILYNAISYLIRKSNRSWDEYFISIAMLVATRSKDPSTQVGAVITRDKVILSTGYNGFPRGFNDNDQSRYDRPLKYDLIVHAEENAIYNACRAGIKLDGAAIYVSSLFPCHKCARAIVQSGIKSVFIKKTRNSELWNDEGKVAAAIFAECGIAVSFLN